jgi:hypothetical protein
MLEELDAREHRKETMIKTPEEICTLIYSLVFVSLPTTEVHSCAANAERSIKEADSVVPWINQRPTVVA